ncbi:MAG: lipolytic protein [Marmoricola sp.]|nr:lipolytic protein [Marmoricola sp.]
MTVRDSRLDPVLNALLDQVEAVGVVPLAEQSIEQIRQNFTDTVAMLNGPDHVAEPVGRTEDLVVDGSQGGIPVRIYSPTAPDPRAVIVYFHGGGFILGDIDTHDKIARRLCEGTTSTVVSVHYRLAPEHPFPAGFQDCYETTAWAASRYPDVPLLVGGDSAGGALSASVAQRARDEQGPVIAAQVLIYPGVNLDLTTRSMIDNGSGEYALNRDDLATMRDMFLPDEASGSAPYALPDNAETLTGLPPAIVTSAGFDPLLTSNEAYVERLRQDGVSVQYLPNPGLIHGWTELVNTVPAAAAAQDALVDAVSVLITQLTS